jgi:outer membrane protein OmpA-like peptidoglycan-associated protein
MRKTGLFLFCPLLYISSFSQIVNPSACDPTSDKNAKKAFEKAEKSMGMEKVKALGEVINEYPDFYEAIFSQGMALIKLEKFPQAFARFEKVYALCPDYSPYTWYYMGAIYYGNDRFAEAIPFLEKVVKYDGDLKLADKDYEEAKAMLKAAKNTLEITSKSVTYNPVPVRDICTEYDEYTAIISPDNEMLYFIRKIPDNKSIVGYREIFMESENNGWVFHSGRELPPPFNMANNNGAASLTADNKTMYFVVCQNNEFKACDIWYSEKKGIQWSAMSPVPGKLNKGNEWDSQPSVSFDGKEMIFVSDRPGGQGGSDLYISRKLPDGTWSEAQNLGPTINSPQNELTPFLHSDSRTLYFSSKGHNSLGGYDIFFSRQSPDGSWSKPQNIGSPINTVNDEVSFFVSLDGKRGFFSSDKLKGPGGKDVFMFDLHEEARPLQVKLVKGELQAPPGTDKSAEVELKNLRTKEVTKVEVDKNDGKYAAIIEANEDYLMTLRKEGMAFSSHLIEKEKTDEKGVVKADLEMKKIETGQTYNINHLNFATNSYELNDKSIMIIEAFSEFLKTNKSIKVAIHGHTDDVGDDAANLILSELRAKAVYEHLIKTGISKDRLSYKGFGETKPIADNNTETGRQKNRRTEFLILSQ